MLKGNKTTYINTRSNSKENYTFHKVVSRSALASCVKSFIYLRYNSLTSPKQLIWPITTGANSAMNQSEFKANTYNRRQARENTCERGTIGFGFTSYSLRKWREFCLPITARSNAKPKQKRNYFRHWIENRSIYFSVLVQWSWTSLLRPAWISSGETKGWLHFTGTLGSCPQSIRNLSNDNGERQRKRHLKI